MTYVFLEPPLSAHVLLLTLKPQRYNIIYPIIPMATLSIGGRYTAMIFMPCTSVGPQLLLYKTINHHMPRPVAKRAAAIALMNAIGGTSNIWASYLWFSKPRYYAAFGTCMSPSSSVVPALTALIHSLLTLFVRFYVRRENRLLDGTPEEVARVMKRGVTQEQVDMGWRYEGY